MPRSPARSQLRWSLSRPALKPIKISSSRRSDTRLAITINGERTTSKVRNSNSAAEVVAGALGIEVVLKATEVMVTASAVGSSDNRSTLVWLFARRPCIPIRLIRLLCNRARPRPVSRRRTSGSVARPLLPAMVRTPPICFPSGSSSMASEFPASARRVTG